MLAFPGVFRTVMYGVEIHRDFEHSNSGPREGLSLNARVPGGVPRHHHITVRDFNLSELSVWFETPRNIAFGSAIHGAIVCLSSKTWRTMVFRKTIGIVRRRRFRI